MKFVLNFTDTAKKSLKDLKNNSSNKKRYKAVTKSLAYLENNPKHQGLRTHLYYSISGPNGERVYEAYAEQNTPAAYRIFFYYGPKRGDITIYAITAHP